MGIPIGDLERVREIDKDDNLVLGRGETNKAMKANASQLADFVNKELLPEKEQREQELDNYINQIKEDVKEKSDEANAEIEKVVEEQTGKDWGRLERDIESFTNPFEKSEYNETNLTDTDSTFIKDLKAYGDSWKSKNLLETTLQTTTRNGITCTANGDGTYTLNGTCTSGTSFAIIATLNQSFPYDVKYVGVPSGCNSYLALGIEGESDKTINNGNGVIIPANKVITVAKFWINQNDTFDNVVFKPMITTDLSATYNDYEPYGLHKIEELNFDVRGRNKVTNKNNVEITTSNKGWVFKDALLDETLNGTYTLSFDIKINDLGGSSQEQILFYAFNGGSQISGNACNFVVNKTTDEFTRMTLNFVKNVDFDCIGLSSNAPSITIKNIMLTQPSDDVNYKPYQGHTSFKVVPPRPLSKVGDVRDVLDVESGEWKYGNGIADLGGFEWKYESAYTRFYSDGIKPFIKIPGSKEKLNALCDVYETTSNSEDWDGRIDKRVYCSGGTLYIVDKSYTNATDFKNAMQGVKLIYELATPTTKPIASNDLSLLHTLQTYAPETNISITDQNGNEIDREFLFSSGAVGYAVDAGTVRGMDVYTIINDLLKRVEALENRPSPSGGGDGFNITVVNSTSDTKGGIFNE